MCRHRECCQRGRNHGRGRPARFEKTGRIVSSEENGRAGKGKGNLDAPREEVRVAIGLGVCEEGPVVLALLQAGGEAVLAGGRPSAWWIRAAELRLGGAERARGGSSAGGRRGSAAGRSSHLSSLGRRRCIAGLSGPAGNSCTRCAHRSSSPCRIAAPSSAARRRERRVVSPTHLISAMTKERSFEGGSGVLISTGESSVS